jgi:hypothetical protein
MTPKVEQSPALGIVVGINLKMVLLVFLFLLGMGCTAVLAAPGQKKSKEPVKLYLFYRINKDNIVDDAQLERRDTTKDIANRLKHDKLIQLVVDEERDKADVTVEVVSRGIEAGTGLSTFAVVHMVLRHGDYATEITGWENMDPTTRSFTPWRTAAMRASEAIERWIKNNYDKLVAVHQANQVAS